jgi:hypothetical protein
MRDYPIASLLYWHVDGANVEEFRWYDFVLNYHELEAPGCPPHVDLPAGDRIAVLDGQQRLTALNVGLRGSHAARTKYRPAGRPQSYPKRFLYLDICAEPRLSEDRYEELIYRFDFLEEGRASAETQEAEGVHWFRVSELREFPHGADAGVAINRYLRERQLADHPNAFETLFTLWNTIYQQRHLSHFTENEQDLDRVLDIFIRVNSQGQPLAKSDLLMSIATAQWVERDAREEIPATLRQINGVQPGFAFARDHVLKAGLVLAGISDVGFRAETFNRENMQRLETSWDEISATLYRAVELLSSFGLSRDTIDARMVLIPIAYYLHRRGLDDRYLGAPTEEQDRQRVRDWTIRALLMPGVFGSGLDTLLGRLRRVIDEAGEAGFPSDAIEDAMAAMGKSLRFEPQTIEELVNSRYGKPDTFALLSILYPHVDPTRRFHVDHVFPQAKLRRDRLRPHYEHASVERIVTQYRDGLANLQLLQGPENIGKSDELPRAWAHARHDPARLDAYLRENDIEDLPADIDEFLSFYEQRRERMKERLVRVLGREPGSLREPRP